MPRGEEVSIRKEFPTYLFVIRKWTRKLCPLWLSLALLATGIFCLVQYGTGEEERPHEALSLIEKGSYRQASISLKKLLDKSPNSLWGKRALYLLGYIEQQQNHPSKAILYYELARQKYGKLGDYIELTLAKLYIAQEDHEKAYQILKEFQQNYPWSLLLSQAQLYGLIETIELGRYKEAARKFMIFMERYSRSPSAPQAVLTWAQSLEDRNKTEEAWNFYQQIHIAYPLDPAAEIAWKRMMDLNSYRALALPTQFLPSFQKRAQRLFHQKEYDKALKDYRVLIFLNSQSKAAQEGRFKAALCYYRIRNRLQAGRLLETFIPFHPQSSRLPEALYWIGKSYWNNNMNQEGRIFLGRLLSEFPAENWTEKSLYVLGRMAEGEKDSLAARIFYEHLVSEFPQGNMATESHWRLGWINYREGKPSQSTHSFQELSRINSNWLEPALYWQGRTLAPSGDREGAISVFERLTGKHHYSYYNIKEEKRREGLLQEKADIEGKQMEIFTLKPISADNNPPPKENLRIGEEEAFHLQRLKELGEMNFREECRQEIAALAQLLPPRKESRFYAGELYFQNHMFFRAIKTLNRDFRSFPPQQNGGLSIEFWKTFYPRLYWNHIRQQAKKNHLDPFLIAALIRQESAFERKAVSPSGAHGLMQLLPSTGKPIFRKLGLANFRREKLFNPRINILLGTHYLAQLLERFNGNLPLALAGYNAGPGKVERWLKRSRKMNKEAFIEGIPYGETKNYVKKVLRNFFIYRSIYGSQT